MVEANGAASAMEDDPTQVSKRGLELICLTMLPGIANRFIRFSKLGIQEDSASYLVDSRLTPFLDISAHCA
jgi:hypothetical protein